jgi:RimJ/RimL family protein N-acetyltransferase
MVPSRECEMDVSLRRATEEDAAVFAAVRREPSAVRFQPLRLYSEERLRAVLRQRAARSLDRCLDGKVQWVILADGEPVGWITLDVTSREHAIGSIGYTVAERARGRGVARSALAQAVAIAFDRDGVALERLEAVVATENVASQRVLASAGFRREGLARGLLRVGGERLDHYRYGLLRDEWLRRQPGQHHS